MARNLVSSLEKAEGIKLYILRSNGKEEAFKDLKTINAVKKEYGEIKPEWLTDHPDEKENAARDAGSPDFIKAYKAFKDDWRRGEIYYIDKSGATPEFVYLQPIEKRPKCNTCHSTEGARGILVIRTSLDDMYKILERGRNQWIISGILAVSVGGVLLSLVIRRSFTGPLKKNVEVIKRIAEGKREISERLEVTSENEIGYFAKSFNDDNPRHNNRARRKHRNKKPGGGGASVTILIPISGEEQWVKVEKAAQDQPRGRASGKKILIVDDERSIREAVEDVLTVEGYKVETAREGAEALETLEKDRFALVITDIKMPGLDGTELYENILKKHDYLKDKIIISTGDVFSPKTKDFIEKYGCHYLLKPFEMKELTGLVRKILS